MTTVTGFTAERMLGIENSTIVGGEIIDGNLILTTRDGTPIDAGPVAGPPGPVGPMGPGAGRIPGEVRLWSSTVPPPADPYGIWVWADGSIYTKANHPLAAANIGNEWRQFAGAPDPGVPNFRVPDLRGLVPAGLDAMPGGSRASRMTRSVAIILAGKTGEELHVISVPEIPSHNHGGSIGVSGSISGSTDSQGSHGGHANGVGMENQYVYPGGSGTAWTHGNFGGVGGGHSHGVGGSFSGSGAIPSQGGGGGHENVQPTVFVPYIVHLDDPPD
jgi:microcystin-dependent protein